MFVLPQTKRLHIYYLCFISSTGSEQGMWIAKRNRRWTFHLGSVLPTWPGPTMIQGVWSLWTCLLSVTCSKGKETESQKAQANCKWEFTFITDLKNRHYREAHHPHLQPHPQPGWCAWDLLQVPIDNARQWCPIFRLLFCVPHTLGGAVTIVYGIVIDTSPRWTLPECLHVMLSQPRAASSREWLEQYCCSLGTLSARKTV